MCYDMEAVAYVETNFCNFVGVQSIFVKLGTLFSEANCKTENFGPFGLYTDIITVFSHNWDYLFHSTSIKKLINFMPWP